MHFPEYYTLYIFTVLPLLLMTIILCLSKGVTQTKKHILPFVFSLGFLTLWTISMFFLGYQGFFAASSLPTGPVATGSFVIIGLLAYFLIPSCKKYILSIPLHWLIIPQFFRILGGIFVLVTLDGFLPTYWGMTVGLGDFLTGIFTPFVIYTVMNKRPNWKKYVLLWSAFGLFDVVHAIVIATISTPSPFQLFYPHPGIETTNYYPLILIVVIARPMVVLLHLYILAKFFDMKK